MAQIASILDSVKKNLGLDTSFTSFDPDITTHINSTFLTLQQLGIGPESGFMIEDNTTVWVEYIGLDKNLNAVKSYIYLKVRLLFDPPATSFAITAMENQVQEFEWRLNALEFTKIPASNSSVLWWDLTLTEVFPDEAPSGALGINFITGVVWRKD